MIPVSSAARGVNASLAALLLALQAIQGETAVDEISSSKTVRQDTVLQIQHHRRPYATAHFRPYTGHSAPPSLNHSQPPSHRRLNHQYAARPPNCQPWAAARQESTPPMTAIGMKRMRRLDNGGGILGVAFIMLNGGTSGRWRYERVGQRFAVVRTGVTPVTLGGCALVGT